MKNILKRLRALFRFAPRPDPLELIVRVFALDPDRRAESHQPKEPRSDKRENPE
jgi:hypothetical protein